MEICLKPLKKLLAIDPKATWTRFYTYEELFLWMLKPNVWEEECRDESYKVRSNINL